MDFITLQTKYLNTKLPSDYDPKEFTNAQQNRLQKVDFNQNFSVLTRS